MWAARLRAVQGAVGRVRPVHRPGMSTALRVTGPWRVALGNRIENRGWAEATVPWIVDAEVRLYEGYQPAAVVPFT